RFAETEVELLALHRCLKANALDLEFLLKADRNSGDHIGDQRTGESMQRFALPALIVALDADRTPFDSSANSLWQIPRQLAFWALDGNTAFRANIDRHFRRHFNG